MRTSLRIYTWNRVTSDSEAAGEAPAGSAFGRQLGLLRRWGNIVDLESATDRLFRGLALPPRAVALTFDEGYRDQLEVAVPLLEDLGLAATFFLTTGFLDRRTVPWWERLAWDVERSPRPDVEFHGLVVPLENTSIAVRQLGDLLGRMTVPSREAALDRLEELLEVDSKFDGDSLLMDWDDATALASRGMNIGSHSDMHPVMIAETEAAQHHDLVAAAKSLRQNLSVPVRSVAYPHGEEGNFDRKARRAARAAGHRYALCAIPGVNRPSAPPMALRRVSAGLDHPRLAVMARSWPRGEKLVRRRKGVDSGG